MLWLSRSSEVRSRSGDDLSPLSGLFFNFILFYSYTCGRLNSYRSVPAVVVRPYATWWNTRRKRRSSTGRGRWWGCRRYRPRCLETASSAMNLPASRPIHQSLRDAKERTLVVSGSVLFGFYRKRLVQFGYKTASDVFLQLQTGNHVAQKSTIIRLDLFIYFCICACCLACF